MNYGFVRAAAAVPALRVADCAFNAKKIIELVCEAAEAGVQCLVFPELSITGYTCGDLFHQQALLGEAEVVLGELLKETEDSGVTVILGMPIRAGGLLFNCGVTAQKGKILGVVPKSYVPARNGSYEAGCFASGFEAVADMAILCGQKVPFGTDLLFEAEEDPHVCFGLEIGDDLWVPIPPSSYQAISGATLLFNLSASSEAAGKHEYRKNLVAQQSGRCVAGYVYASCGVDESTTDAVFGGHAVIAENGTILDEARRFLREGRLIRVDIDTERLVNDRFGNTGFRDISWSQGRGFPKKQTALQGDRLRRIPFHLRQIELKPVLRPMSPHPFVPSDPGPRDRRCREIFSIQTAGLAKRIVHTRSQHAVIGVSGGLDSTLALMAAAGTFDLLGMSRERIIAVTMPGFGTSDETYGNALELMRSIGVSMREISIKDACLQHFRDIGHDPDVHDAAYENVQARERTQILMDLANKVNGLVVGTGDLSELALGWCTYNGDHMSMYAVNCGIPKTLVKYLVQWAADHAADAKTGDVLRRILHTPITPELLPMDPNGGIGQKTEDIVGPYELHDFFLYHMVRYGASPCKILFLAEQVFMGAYDADAIKKWLKVFCKRFFSQQFKRSCSPDGPKVGSISLSPRGGWYMPSDAVAAAWLKELE